MIFTWKLQGTTNTEITETDYLFFCNGTFNSNIVVDEFNESTHVKTNAGIDKSSGNTPKNNKYISNTEIQVDGGSTVNLNTISNSDAALTINVTDGTFAIEDALFYTFNGASPSQPSEYIDTYAAEVGDSEWTHAINRTAGLPLNNKTTNTSHDYYIAISISPQNPGIVNATMRLEGVMS